MTDALLVVSSNPSWREALQLELDAVGIATVVCSDSASAIQALESRELDCYAAVVDEHMRAGRGGADQLGAIYMARVIRGACPDLPILFLATAPFDAGMRFARDDPLAKVIVSAHLDSDRPGQIRDTLEWLKRWAEQVGEPADSASIEIEISDTQVKITVDRQPEEIRAWAGRNRLSRLGRRFRDWRLYEPHAGGRRLTPLWRQQLHHAGEDLLEELQLHAFPSLQKCLNGAANQEHLHFRFNVHDDDDLIDLPFELIHHQVASDTFMREVSPVARRLVLKPGATFRRISGQSTARAVSDRPTVLCILSDVEGILAVQGCRFGGEDTAPIRKLTGLKEEGRAIQEAHKAAGRTCSVLRLRSGDPISVLEAEMRKHWDVIHFAGHSIRADDGSNVFLVLPGETRTSSQLRALPMRSFADLVSQAEAGLVVLSSCESSSVEAIIRLAQYGISTVVGFRWEVLDNGARLFSSALHRGLARQEPIGRAFMQALKGVMAEADTPTFASAVLLVQSDSWAGPVRSPHRRDDDDVAARIAVRGNESRAWRRG